MPGRVECRERGKVVSLTPAVLHAGDDRLKVWISLRYSSYLLQLL